MSTKAAEITGLHMSSSLTASRPSVCDGDHNRAKLDGSGKRLHRSSSIRDTQSSFFGATGRSANGDSLMGWGCSPAESMVGNCVYKPGRELCPRATDITIDSDTPQFKGVSLPLGAAIDRITVMLHGRLAHSTSGRTADPGPLADA